MFEYNDYKVISPTSDTYVAAYKQKIEYVCPNGHTHSILYAEFARGHRCPECAGLLKKNIDDIKKEFEKENYMLLSTEYINSKRKLKFICPNGHTHSMRYNDWNGGHRCSKCSNRVSKQEKELSSFIKTFYNDDVIENDRTQIKNPSTGNYLELDIWLPKLKKAIEFNGEFWHTKNRDEIKHKMCLDKHIALLTIWYTDWIQNKENTQKSVSNFILESLI